MSSHEPFGTHDQYLTPPVHYLTMLREPMEKRGDLGILLSQIV